MGPASWAAERGVKIVRGAAKAALIAAHRSRRPTPVRSAALSGAGDRTARVLRIAYGGALTAPEKRQLDELKEIHDDGFTVPATGELYGQRATSAPKGGLVLMFDEDSEMSSEG